jgi:hypothetical protein
MTSLYANLEKARPYVLSIIRIIVALMFMEHGFQKFFAFPSAGPDMTPLLYVQGVIEIVGGVLLLLGLLSRPVAFILAGDMASLISSPIIRARSSRRSISATRRSSTAFSSSTWCSPAPAAGASTTPPAWRRIKRRTH